MKISKKVIILMVLVFVFLPVFAQAVSWWPLVPCGTSVNSTPCNQCDLFKLLKNIIDFVLLGLMPPAAAILFVWGGFLILMGGANPGWITQGKSIFWNTAIGVAIILASWLITNSIIRSIAADNIAPEWWKFECRVTTPPQPTTTPPQPTTTVQPSGEAICKFTGVNLCQASNRTPYNSQTMVCSDSRCGQYITAINQYARGAASANLLKAIMVKESSCNAAADSGHAYGLMQFVPSTAVIYANQCGITNAKQVITPQWLKNNPALSICLASKYLQAISQTACGSSIRNIAAGYNGGEIGACNLSVDCKTEKSCDGSAVKRWECLYDNPEHTVCNDTRAGNYDETRDYAVKVLYCYNNPGF